MATSEPVRPSSKEEEVKLTGADIEEMMSYVLEKSLESIVHDLLIEVHRSEKAARTQSLVVELQQKAERHAKLRSQVMDAAETEQDDVVIETSAATLKNGTVRLKGNPMQTVKNVLCPNCRLPRLLYPRVGLNSRPPPDANQQYCKNEPAIILDKHDVHGQRKKGVKMKGQAKAKNKKKADVTSPASSEKSDLTPSTASLPADAFEFKEIEYPAAKCPNKESHLGDHWKAVNVFATHLNGSCWLKRDRAAGREAVAKMSGTPLDSRASSPKPVNGPKRARPADDAEGGGEKKKQKMEMTPKKNSKVTLIGPSKLREDSSQVDHEDIENGSVSLDVDGVAGGDGRVPGGGAEKGKKAGEASKKVKTNGVTGTTARKKPTKVGKKT